MSLVIGTVSANEPQPRIGAAQRALTIEDRVAAQRAIEHVYYRHQIGVTKPFDEAVPRAVLEAKVQKVLEQTVALEVYWKTRVTNAMLGRELERMTGGSRAPDRLQELFAALGNDPFLIKECLARATLVDRLTRNFYAFDGTLHAEARRRAEELHRQLATGALDPSSDYPNRTVVDLVLREPKTGEPAEPERQGNLLNGTRPAPRELSPEEFRKERARLPDAPGSVAVVAEERDAFVIRVVLSETPGEVRAASYVVAKRNWDQWWQSAKKDLRGERVAAVASNLGSLPVVRNHRGGDSPPCAADDTWDSDGGLGFEAARTGHTAVWTGSVMVVWGGSRSQYSVFNTGARYDPATDTWTATSTVGAPSERVDQTAVWTGSVMVVWGGNYPGFSVSSFETGGRYDPVTDTWTATSTAGAPSGRFGHKAVWTGRVMLVWGGEYYDGDHFQYHNTGGRYDPLTDTWTATSTVAAPSARTVLAAVWTGREMVLWGGFFSDGGGSHYLNNGGRYDPATDTWTAVSTVDAPFGGVTAVWTGSVMVVWVGGTGSGGRYDPATDAWTPTSTVAAPSARTVSAAVWTGREMVVWGGYALDNGNQFLNTGGRYDPVTDTWTATSTEGAPSGRGWHTAVWTGSAIVVWGGAGGGAYLNTGGRYDPATDTWTPTSTAWAPSARYGHTAVWTGSVMVVWGGIDNNYQLLDTGGRYDPATDTWEPTSTVGTPGGSYGHYSVWTGNVMVVPGGRYDPGTDTWAPMSAPGALSLEHNTAVRTATSNLFLPPPLAFETAVWTGREMIVWGGDNIVRRYDPVGDTWTVTSAVGAPSPRSWHSAVWTGSAMVVWGGWSDGDPFWVNTGGRYDPVTDTWTPTSAVGAPSARFGHTAVWTGREMVVWGGYGYDDDGFENSLNTGGRYEPVTDTWTTTSTVGAPSARDSSHTAIWTGREMVVWGGTTTIGGRYDPAKDTWTAMSTVGAPFGDQYHTALWIGNAMVVWGGITHPGISGTGARYIVVNTSDDDGDGYKVCDGDCDDANPAVHPGAVEVCNGIDDNCDGQVDEGGNALCDDHDVCTEDICQGAEGCVNRLLDHDGDGVCDATDQCPATILTPTVVIDTCDSGVGNHQFPGGCNFGDEIAACRASARNHGQFVSCVAHVVDAWKKAGLIAGQQGSRIVRCAAQ